MEMAHDALVTKEPEELFTPSMRAQLKVVFERMENPLKLSVLVNEGPLSDELRRYMKELSSMTGKLTIEEDSAGGEVPSVRIFREDGSWSGFAFHGVPGGHEFQGFVLAMYNTAGPGQPLSDEEKEKIRAIDGDVNISVFVSLSCQICSDLVGALQCIVTHKDSLTMDVYDLNHFPGFRATYRIMGLPCFVIQKGKREGRPQFGFKSMDQLLNLLNQE